MVGIVVIMVRNGKVCKGRSPVKVDECGCDDDDDDDVACCR